MNYAAVDRGGEVEEVEVLREWADLNVDMVQKDDAPEFIQKVVRPVNAQRGYDLPVSVFVGREDGTWEHGTATYEKRGVVSFASFGIPTTASSVTSVPTFVRTLLSVRSCSMRKNRKGWEKRWHY